MLYIRKISGQQFRASTEKHGDELFWYTRANDS